MTAQSSARPRETRHASDTSVYGWDQRDALTKTAKSCREAIKRPNDDLLD
jgi:hypothetical protein